jgi:thiamine biosynthesis protein ThiS
MRIFVNEESNDIQEGSTLKDLREQLGIVKDEGFAFAKNEEIIPHAVHEKTFLAEFDRIVIIQATQGG